MDGTLLLLLAAPEVGSCCSGYGDRLRARSSDATGQSMDSYNSLDFLRVMK
jgi:hypothetical protein